MKFKIVQYEEDLYANFWFYPLVLTVSAILLAFTVELLDSIYHWPWLIKTGVIYSIGAGGAREILSVLAMSVITITSVTFSIAVLILSLASQQLGHRLLPNFMRQGRTQLVLGIFIGTFVYCLLELRTIPDTIQIGYFPALMVLIALILGVVSFFTLIYFIHYICHAIQINNVLDYIRKDLEKTLSRQFPKREKKEVFEEYADESINLTDKFKLGSIDICADNIGYIETIDYDEIVSLAEKHDAFICLSVLPGDYLIEGSPILKITAKSSLDNKTIASLQDCFQLGIRRTTIQDVRLGFELYIEIALRALSPAVNSPYTAINCLNCAEASLAYLSHRYIPSPYLKDSNNCQRVIIKPFSYKAIVAVLFQRLRQEAVKDIQIAKYIFQIVNELASNNNLILAFRVALLHEATLLYEACQREPAHEHELEELSVSYRKLTLKLKKV